MAQGQLWDVGGSAVERPVQLLAETQQKAEKATEVFFEASEYLPPCRAAGAGCHLGLRGRSEQGPGESALARGRAKPRARRAAAARGKAQQRAGAASHSTGPWHVAVERLTRPWGRGRAGPPAHL